LSRSPEHKSRDAADFVGQVLQAAYPCKAGT
jgi:hypothetical protein